MFVLAVTIVNPSVRGLLADVDAVGDRIAQAAGEIQADEGRVVLSCQQPDLAARLELWHARDQIDRTTNATLSVKDRRRALEDLDSI